jgi:Ca2+-binding EF-hand superfamily protein
MKVVAFIVSAMLGIAGAAHADEYTGPVPPPAPAPMAAQPGALMPPPMQRPRGALREALLERFDTNHDGRLEPNERRHAARALRRLARRLMMQDRAAARAQRRALRGVIRRYDLDGDGNVSPGEMAPDMANRLRPLDRNGDGWVDERDFDR